MTEVICTKEEHKLCAFRARAGNNSEVKSADTAGVLMKDVNTVPAFSLVDKICLFS